MQQEFERIKESALKKFCRLMTRRHTKCGDGVERILVKEYRFEKDWGIFYAKQDFFVYIVIFS